ncbi:hypothetical protein JZ751_009096, partial [Albula glossodonta]
MEVWLAKVQPGSEQDWKSCRAGEERRNSNHPKITMTSEAPGVTEAADRKCPLGDTHIHRDQDCQIIKVWHFLLSTRALERNFGRDSELELLVVCRYASLPLSLGGLAITGALLYNGVLVPSKRFGPFPKLAVAGILGYMLGKVSYMRTCREKFHRLGVEPFGPGFRPGFWGHGHGPQHRSVRETSQLLLQREHKADQVPYMHPASGRQPVLTAGPTQELQYPQQQHRQAQLAGEGTKVKQGKEIDVLQGIRHIEPAGLQQLSHRTQKPPPLFHCAPWQRLRHGNQQAFAEH